MKPLLMFLLFGFMLGSTVYGQIKIGDNPQNIDASSVLELESNTRVLVITRINTAQMNAIVPNPGAMVYNTDTDCVHYYNGTEWINICEEVGGIPNLTTNPLVNNASTLVITPNGENNHIEVAPNSIRTEHIVDGGINGVDIQDNSIGQNKIGNDAVGRNEIIENAIGLEALDTDQITLANFNNTPGFITAADIVSGTPGNVITDNGGAFYDDSTLQTGIAANTSNIATNTGSIAANAGNITAYTSSLNNHIITDLDIDDQNEFQDLEDVLSRGNSANGVVISNVGEPVAAQDAATRNYVDTQIAGSTQTIRSEQAGNDIVLGVPDGGAYYDDSPLRDNIAANTSNIAADGDTSATNELTDLAFDIGTNVLSLTNSATIPGAMVNLTSLVNTDNQTITDFSFDPATNFITLTLQNGGTETINLSTLSGTGSDNQQLTLEPGNLLTLVNGGTPIDLTSFLNTDNQTITDFSFDPATNIITLTLQNGGTETINLSTLSGTGSDNQQLTLEPGNLLTLVNGGTPIDLTSFLNTDNQQLTLEPSNLLTLANGGTPVDLTPYLDDQTITDFTFDNISNILTLTIDGGNTDTADLSALAGGGTPAAADVTFTPTPNTTSTDVQAAIEELQLDIDAFSAVSGQTNTASNVGIAGEGLFLQKTGANLEFKNINAASNKVAVTNDAANNEVDIDIVDANLAITESQITDLAHTVNTDNQTATDVPFTAIGNTNSTDVQAAIVELQGDIDVLGTSPGEVNTTSNQGTGGVTLALPKVGVDLPFKNINAASNKVTVTNDAANNEVDIDIVDANLAITESQISDLAHTPAATAVTFAPIGNTTSADVQAAIVELQGDIDVLGTNPGEVNTTSNQGTGGVTLALPKVGVDLPFKNINAASNKVTVTNDAANNEVDIDIVDVNLAITESQISDLAHTPAATAVTFAPIGNTTSADVQAAIVELQGDIDVLGTSPGEVNTTSNQGIGGVALALPKVGIDLPFKNINAASNKVTVTNDAANNEVDIDIVDANLAITESQITDLVHTVNTDNQTAAAVPFAAVGNTTSTDVQAAIEEIQTEVDGISVTGEANTSSNQGAGGVSLALPKVGVDLPFKNINAASNKVTVTNDAANNEVDIDIVDANLAITESQISDLAHTPAATAVTFAPTGNTTSADVQAAIVELQGDIDVLGTNPGEVNTTSNQGTGGVTLALPKVGVDLPFKNINAASNKVTVTNDAANNEVDIDIVDANLAITESQISDLAHTPAATAVTFAPTGNTTSPDVQAAIVELQTDIDGISAGGEVNTSSNQGAGGVTLALPKVGVDLPFKNINAASNKVTVTNDAANNEVDIDIVDANLAITESQITDLVHTVNTDNQTAAAVPFAAVGNTTSTDVQAAIEEIQTEVDGISVTGEANTSSNQGAGGVSLALPKVGVDLPFKNINAASNKVTVTNDVANNEVDIDIVDANLAITESQITDLVHTVNSDNQNAAAVPYDNTIVSLLTATTTQAAIDELAASGGSDNQTIDALSFDNATGTLSISLEDDAQPVQTVIVPNIYTANGSLSGVGDRTINLATRNLIFNSSFPTSGNVGIAAVPTPTQRLRVGGNLQVDGNFNATGDIAATGNINGTDISATGNIDGTDITANGDINVTGSVFRAAIDLHPDFVFQKYFTDYSVLDPTYNFWDLGSIENFIKANHHLPGIKSAKQVKEDGVWNLSESNIMNLEKIEELFLHTIEQEKKIDQLKSENKSLSKELEAVRSDIDLIKQLLLNKEKNN